MKTKILSLAMIALMIGMVINTYALNEDTTKLAKPSSEMNFQAAINFCTDSHVKFLVENPENDKVKLRIYDDSGIKLYTYSFKKENFARICFDISQLDAGTYECVVERNKEEVLRKTIEKVAE
jgi:hypothetical protein